MSKVAEEYFGTLYETDCPALIASRLGLAIVALLVSLRLIKRGRTGVLYGGTSKSLAHTAALVGISRAKLAEGLHELGLLKFVRTQGHGHAGTTLELLFPPGESEIDAGCGAVLRQRAQRLKRRDARFVQTSRRLTGGRRMNSKAHSSSGLDDSGGGIVLASGGRRLDDQTSNSLGVKTTRRGRLMTRARTREVDQRETRNHHPAATPRSQDGHGGGGGSLPSAGGGGKSLGLAAEKAGFEDQSTGRVLSGLPLAIQQVLLERDGARLSDLARIAQQIIDHDGRPAVESALPAAITELGDRPGLPFVSRRTAIYKRACGDAQVSPQPWPAAGAHADGSGPTIAERIASAPQDESGGTLAAAVAAAKARSAPRFAPEIDAAADEASAYAAGKTVHSYPGLLEKIVRRRSTGSAQ